MSRLFTPSGESQDSSSEGSQRGSPCSLPWPNTGVFPHNQGVVASSESGLQVNQLAGNHSASGAPDLHDLTGILQRQEDMMKDIHRQMCDKLQSVQQDYKQSFAKFKQVQKSQFDQLKQDITHMQIQIRSVEAQVKGLQLPINKLTSKDKLAAVQHNADVRIGEVEQCLDATRQEMESRCQRMDKSIHDLSERVTSVERNQFSRFLMLGLTACSSVNLSVWVSVITLTCTIPQWIWENLGVPFCIQL